MIAFLTLLYVGLLFLLVKLKIIKLNLFWKISPVLWLFVLLIVLFIPMQWGAPAGAVRMYQAVVEIIPNVTGEIIEIPSEPLKPMNEGDVIFKIDPETFQNTVDGKRAELAAAEQAVPQLEADLEAAKASVEQAKASRDQAKQSYERYASANRSPSQPFSELEVENRRLRVVGAEQAVNQAVANERRAQLAYESQINGVNTTVARIESELKNAEWNLKETVVRAPSDGFLIGFSLRAGQRVGNFPVRSWVAFVNTNENRLALGISQRRLRYIKPGQTAEVVFNLYPGRVFKAKVQDIVQMTAAGQLQASGVVTTAPTPQQAAEPYGVILVPDDPNIDTSKFFGGSVGTAAIYTDQMKATHLIRKVMLRMEAWMNYILP
ncbi:MAG: HlyD family secretion protein [Hyphomicrobiales bacterium]